MIGLIKGIVVEKDPPQVLLEIHGIGYEVYLPISSFCMLPEIGKTTVIYTHLIIRDEAHILFGFIHKQEKILFRELIKVNGIGPKLALTILSEIPALNFVNAVIHQEIKTLIKLSGIGEKTAKRMIVEMQDRLKDLFKDESLKNNSSNSSSYSSFEAIKSEKEAIDALVVLGYKVKEAIYMVKKVKNRNDNTSADCESLIRDALRIAHKVTKI